jgi:3-oxoadipate enol-lactonase
VEFEGGQVADYIIDLKGGWWGMQGKAPEEDFAMATDIQRSTVQVGSVSMHYVTSGSGPAVTFLHPVGLNGQAWKAQFEPLSRYFRLLAPDFRGHGRSPAGDSPFSLEDLVDDVLALWDDLGIASSHVVGLSMGGMVAQGLTLRAPDRVGSVVLVDTAGTLSDAGRAAMRGRASATRQMGMDGVVDATIERWFTTEAIASRAPAVSFAREIMLGDDPVTHANAWEAISSLNYLDRLGQVAKRTLVVVGEKDVSTPPAMAEALAAAIPGARLQVVPGGAHMFPVETPEALTALLLDFLR